MKTLVLLSSLFISAFTFSQTAADIFRSTDYEYTYLGIDYSHAKFIGDFNQFADAGQISYARIKNEFFGRWNNVVIREPEKYDLKAMLRKEYIDVDLSTIKEVNSKTSIEDMEAISAKPLKEEDIQSIIKKYKFEKKEGIGILFIAEYLDKTLEEGCFHFVAINLKSKKILVHGRYTGEAAGFGLRNYWMRPIFLAIEEIKDKSYNKWKKEYTD